MTSTADKITQFRALHAEGTFILPNAWDAGSAVMLEKLGFQAIASTSAGFAQALGRNDGHITLEEKLAHLTSLCAATHLPVNADFEHGFADAPQMCADNVLRAADTGIAGVSVEDWSRTEMYSLDDARARIAACADALHKRANPPLLTARAEGLLRRTGTLTDVIERLSAFAEAGADVLYAPGLSSDEAIQAVLDSTDLPVNVLCAFMPDKNFVDYETLGVRRISVGSALSNHALSAALNAATQMLEQGDFRWMLNNAPGSVFNQMFAPPDPPA